MKFGGALLRAVRTYLGAGRWGRRTSIASPAALERFLDSRASHVAQTSLYGYLRTRAGMRYPVLFDDDVFMVSMNEAKWQIWLACLADLTVFAGGLAARRAGAGDEVVGAVMTAAAGAILDRTGVPEEAGGTFSEAADAVRRRLENCVWTAVPDDEGAFVTSPEALVRWAPIVEHLKALDAEIVRNSVRFRWHEVRRELRRDLDAEALLGVPASAGTGTNPPG